MVVSLGRSQRFRLAHGEVIHLEPGSLQGLGMLLLDPGKIPGTAG